MLQKSACNKIFTTSSTLGPLIAQVKALTPPESTLVVEDAPIISQCYLRLGNETSSDPFTPYPDFQTSMNLEELLFYLHSSGSTGFPKPVPQTNRTFLGWCSLGAFFSFPKNSYTDLTLCYL